MIWGKIIGVLVGFKLGGPLGALVGAIVGHWVDVRLFGKTKTFGRQTQAQARAAERQAVFSTSVVNLAAKLAKVDGPVSREEVDAFKAEFAIPRRKWLASVPFLTKPNAKPVGSSSMRRGWPTLSPENRWSAAQCSTPCTA